MEAECHGRLICAVEGVLYLERWICAIKDDFCHRGFVPCEAIMLALEGDICYKRRMCALEGKCVLWKANMCHERRI